ncbi:hypothetical protein D791_03608 [Nitrincola nitratireducens]|uniref:Uncharacterized protein n=1 Tax=Nitrincola nitratireducens TaxID=1229521 RepID=W9UQU4_9GAMM|nr:hypothetical protein D791_03608 [Nitrincola nitratireducens]
MRRLAAETRSGYKRNEYQMLLIIIINTDSIYVKPVL